MKSGKVLVETIDYLESYIFEGFIHEITELLQKTFTDKDDNEIRELMEKWWDSLVVEKNNLGDELDKDGKIVEDGDLDDVKKIHKILIDNTWDNQHTWIEDCEDMNTWFFDMDWGVGNNFGNDLSFEDEDERAEELGRSIDYILSPNNTYIKDHKGD